MLLHSFRSKHGVRLCSDGFMDVSNSGTKITQLRVGAGKYINRGCIFPESHLAPHHRIVHRLLSVSQSRIGTSGIEPRSFPISNSKILQPWSDANDMVQFA